MIEDIKKKLPIFQGHISRTLIIYTLLFSSLITLTLTSIHLYRDYRNGITQIKDSINQIEVSYLNGIINSLWVSDIELLQIQLDGMLKLNDLIYIDISDDKGIIIQAGELTDSQQISKEFPLSYSYANKTMSLGTLRVVYTLKNLYISLLKTSAIIVISQSIKTFLVSGFIFFIFYTLVTRHLNSLANYAKTLNLSALDTPFTLQNKLNGNEKDEFNIVTNAINEMRINLSESYRRLQEEIKERISIEKALKENSAFSETILSMSPDIIYIYDIIQKKNVYSNNGVMRILGYSVEEIQNMGDTVIQTLMHPDDFLIYSDKVIPLYLSARDGEIIEHEYRMKNKDGDWCWLYSKELVFSRQEDGKPNRIFGIISDITQRKRAEEENKVLQEQFLQAQKMESIGRLAGGVAHDFNNMLSVIDGYAELGLDDVSPDDPIAVNFKEIRQAAKRSSDITRQLLAFARRQTISPIVLNLNDAISGMLTMLRRLIGEDVFLEWKPGHELWHVKMDPVQVDQVIVNLCVNSRDAIDDVGRITIETANFTADETFCSSRKDFSPGKYVRITIGDDGHGMDKETCTKIFEPFFTTKKEGQGTGLGLSTVYGIVKQNCGVINVYSEPGKGTIFRLYLTTHDSSSVTKQKNTVKEIVRGNGETLLIVEDEPAILTLICRILDELGYNVLPAVSPWDAIQMMTEINEEVDMLITDVIMPEMNGKMLSDRLRALQPNLKCLYMSGYTADNIAHHGVLDSEVHFIEKPMTKKDLAHKVREVLDS